MRWMRERGRGLAVGSAVVPIVPTAILFDLLNGGDKDWDWPPYRDLAYQATGRAARDFALGNAGAGLGAKAGNLKGGLGSASAVDPASGLQVGALVAVNARGYTTMGDMPQFWAWALEQNGEFGELAAAQARPCHVGVARPCRPHARSGRCCAQRPARQHHHRGGGDQRPARQGVGAEDGDDGTGRSGTVAPPGAHAAGRRHGLCRRHRHARSRRSIRWLWANSARWLRIAWRALSRAASTAPRPLALARGWRDVFGR